MTHDSQYSTLDNLLYSEIYDDQFYDDFHSTNNPVDVSYFVKSEADYFSFIPDPAMPPLTTIKDEDMDFLFQSNMADVYDDFTLLDLAYDSSDPVWRLYNQVLPIL